MQFKSPFTCVVSSPSKGGKSQWVVTFLKHLESLTDGKFDKVIWAYGEGGGVPAEVANDSRVDKCKGVPDSDHLSTHTLLILDDLMRESCSDPAISDLYTRGCRHKKISVILLTQNLFFQSKYSRDISLSTRYFVLLKNVRDRASFSYLARQIYPENAVSLCRALKECWESKPFSYFLIDLDPETPESLRFRSQIWPTDQYIIVYSNAESLKRLTKTNPTFCSAISEH